MPNEDRSTSLAEAGAPASADRVPGDELAEAVLFGSVAHLVRRCQQISVAIFLEECRETGLTPLQFSVLAALRVHGPLDQTKLGGVAALDRTTTAVVVRRLETRGLVSRARSPRDRRAKIVALTEAGVALYETALAAVRRVQERLVAPLSAEERTTLQDLLGRIAAANNELSRAPLRHPRD